MNKPLPEGSRLVSTPNLCRRSSIVLTPQAVRSKPTQGRIPQPQVIRHNAISSQVISPQVIESRVTESQVTNQGTQVKASQAQEPPGRAPGGLRPQAHGRHVQINYISHPTPPGQLDRVRRIKGAGRGKALVIVGNGPSISEAPLELLTGRDRIDLMSINKPDPRLWPTQLWAFCDTSQFRRHQELWQSYNGTIINSTAIQQQKSGTVQVTARQGIGFSRDLTKGFYIGRSTVYANLQTALWMDYDHVFIFGCDMDPAGLHGQLWFYGVNPDAPAMARKDRFKLEAEHYAYAAGEMTDQERAKYTFCSAYNRWPFVDRFRRLDHRVAVNDVLARYGD